MTYESVIGLEIHAQLLTATKIFCGCATTVGVPPNTNVCPVCLGLPGALPVLNRRAVDDAVKAARALQCTVHERSIFARKNYFYPDLPKGYQISQYERPLATDGHLEWDADDPSTRVGIIRVHLEEDAGKSLHEGLPDAWRATGLDFNRSGVPLIEIVTHPDLRRPADAATFFRRLRQILLAVGVNDGNMEEGSLRCDANVSIRPVGASALGVKAEVKNLNSFRFLERAVEYEVARQIDVVESGGRVEQETRLWDDDARETVSMRSKEEAHDYRYFPEPDLPPIVVSAERVAALEAALPELPDARRARLEASYGLTGEDVDVLEATDLVDYFDAVAASFGPARTVFNWVSGEVARKSNALGEDFERDRVPPRELGGLLQLIEQGAVSHSVGKDVYEKMYDGRRTAREVIDAEGLAQIDDRDALLAAVRQAVTAHPDAVAQYRKGKTGSLGFLVGQVMKATRGRANPRVVNELLRAELPESEDPAGT